MIIHVLDAAAVLGDEGGHASAGVEAPRARGQRPFPVDAAQLAGFVVEQPLVVDARRGVGLQPVVAQLVGPPQQVAVIGVAPRERAVVGLGRDESTEIIVDEALIERGAVRGRADVVDRLREQARSVVVVVTSDESAVMRAKGAETAMTIAEHFRDTDHDVLFMMDSATRYAMALREIGLAAGEPPTTKGYPPSVFAALPRLCERAGWSDVNAMTAFFTVLIEGDDIQDPVGDAMRSILDGHVMLSRDLARQHHYPAVDVLGSISRLRQEVAPPELIDAGRTLVRWLKALEENRDLINIGAYVAGSDPVTDAALKRRDAVRAFLTQSMTEPASWDDTARGLLELAAEV